MSSNSDNNQIAGALALPASSSNDQPVPQVTRQPRDLYSLLRYSLEATRAEDVVLNSDRLPMDEERRQFLKDALASTTGNVAEVLIRAVNILSAPEIVNALEEGDEMSDDVMGAFEYIMEYVENIDIANDYYKSGGFSMYPMCLVCENEEVRLNAFRVLAAVCQNNPLCQAKTLECGLLNVLLKRATIETEVALAKCLYAISCLVREYPPACLDLIGAGGCSVLARQLHADYPAARARAAFVIQYLSQHYPEAKEQIINKNVVGTVADHIKAGRDVASEHLLHMLHTLAQGQDRCFIRQCQDPAVNLKKVLEDHLKHKDLVDDSFAEEKQYCRELLQVLGNCPVFMEEEDAAER